MTTIINNNAPAPTTDTTAAAPTKAPAASAPAPKPARVNYAADSFGGNIDAQAFRILLRAKQTSYDLDGKMKRAANSAELGAKVAGVAAQKSQIQGEQHSAMQGLASKLLATGVQGGAGYKGTKMRNSNDDALRARGAGLDSAAQGGALGNVVTSASDMTDKLSGGLHQADQAKVEQKQLDVQVSLATQQKDAAKAQVDASLKGFDDVLEQVKGHFQRLADVISKVTG